MGASFQRQSDKDEFKPVVFETTKPLLRFFAISDFGDNCKEVKSVAAAMNRYATEFNSPPNFITGLGDNFYHAGVQSADDEQFKTTWRDVFLKDYPALRVPWRMVLGNHDYMGNPNGQIDYHYNKKLNKDHLWYMPSNSYRFQYYLGSKSEKSVNDSVSVDFFAVDTNGCQLHVVEEFPNTPNQLRNTLKELNKKLLASTATWKIVMGHHPMYTAGAGHSGTAEFLRDSSKQYFNQQFVNGYSFEENLITGKADAYFSGHEHVFQHHHKKGLHHFGCGAGGAELRLRSNGLYGGKNPDFDMDWVANGNQFGFVCVEIISAREMRVKFIDSNCSTLREVIVQKPSKEIKTEGISSSSAVSSSNQVHQGESL